MKKNLIAACVAVGMCLPFISCAQVQQEWKGVFSELEVSPHQSLLTNVLTSAADSGWKAGLFCFSPGGIKELSNQAVYMQNRFRNTDKIRCYYETRRFNQYAENNLMIGYGKKYSNTINAGLTINFQSQKFSNDYLVKSSLLVQPSCIVQFNPKLNAYARLSVATLKSSRRIDGLVIALRYHYSDHVVMNIDAGLSQYHADCFIGITYLPTDDLKLQMRFDCLSAATAFQIAYTKKRIGYIVGSKYHLPLGLSPFIGITTTL
ncbi:MAG: hypothetical protein ACK5B3_06425 [Bacteroidota bacterium]